MRLSTLTILAAASAVVMGACNENLGDMLDLTPAGPAGPLYGRSWYNSQEARPGDTIIYRPQGYLVPPATPRYGPIALDGLRFDRDGQLLLFSAGPADAPETYLGHWEAVSKDKSILLLQPENTDSHPAYRLRVLALQNDKLQVVRLH